MASPVTSGAAATMPGMVRSCAIRPVGFLICLTLSRGLVRSMTRRASGWGVKRSRIWVSFSRGSSWIVMWPDDSTVSMMNLSENPFIMADMAMNMVTEMVTPAMQTRDWRLWAVKYRVEMNQRIGIQG